jgi:hypothetical protein
MLNRKFKFDNRYLIIGHSAGATLAFQTVNWALTELERKAYYHERKRAITLSKSVAGNLDRIEQAFSAGVEHAEKPGDYHSDEDDYEDSATDSDSDSTKQSGNLEISHFPNALVFTSADGKPLDVPLPISLIALAGIYNFSAYSSRLGGPVTEFLTGAFGPRGPEWNMAAPATCECLNLSKWSPRRVIMFAYSQQDEYVDESETIDMMSRLSSESITCHHVPLTGRHDFVWQDGEQVADLVLKAVELTLENLFNGRH